MKARRTLRRLGEGGAWLRRISKDTPQLPVFVAEVATSAESAAAGRTSLECVRRCLEQFGEPILIDRFLVGFLGRDPLFRQKFLNGVV